MLIHIETKEQYLEQIKEGRVLVDFFATWCGPCMMLSPIVEKISNEHPEVKFLKVDCDQTPDIAAMYGIRSIPTLLYFEGGEIKNRGLGYMPEGDLLKLVGLK
ncbi:MAG: thioredoxin [Bacilli bacterium]|nr:thioredoxin [Bacilli bacterium]